MALFYKLVDGAPSGTYDAPDDSRLSSYTIKLYTLYVSNTMYDGFTGFPGQGIGSTGYFADLDRNILHYMYVRSYNDEIVIMPEDCTSIFNITENVMSTEYYGSPFALDDLSKFDFSQTVTMDKFFSGEGSSAYGKGAMYYCKSGVIDFSKAVEGSLENVESFYYAFMNSGIKGIRFKSNFSKLTDTRYMFSGSTVSEIISYKLPDGRLLLIDSEGSYSARSVRMFYGASKLPGYSVSKAFDGSMAHVEGYFTNPGIIENSLCMKFSSQGKSVYPYIKLGGSGTSATPCIKVDGEWKVLDRS